MRRWSSFFLVWVVLTLSRSQELETRTTGRVFSHQSYKSSIRYSGTGLLRNLPTIESSRVSRLYDSKIHFPSNPLFSTTNFEALGGKCVTSYGTIGNCKPLNGCFRETLLIRAQLLNNCGQQNGETLICCPSSPSTRSTEKPSTSKPPYSPINSPKVTPSIPITKRPNTATPVSIATSPNPIKPISSTELPTLKTTLPKDQQTCGIYNTTEHDNSSKSPIWPWIVSIGHRARNGTIRWHCLGSLITQDFVITSAICLQQEPNVVAVGTALLGPMTQIQSKSLDIRSISQIMVHEKFTKPFFYKNIGMVHINPSIVVSPNLLPICFPFVASVLDVIHFKGYTARTLGFKVPVNKVLGLHFEQEEYKIMGNEMCAQIFEAQKAKTIDQFPYGIKSENLCTLRTEPTSICPAPGAPLVLFDEASRSHVQIGIASGDPTCSKFNRQLVTFSRMNSFSSWVRERVAVFPTPPPCYY